LTRYAYDAYGLEYRRGQREIGWLPGCDRVRLDPGTTWRVSQSGPDTLIDFDGGGQMILVGVNSATLTGDWIGVF